MPEFKTKKEWEAFVDNGLKSGKTPQEMNSLAGMYDGPEGKYTVQQAKKSKRGWTPVDKNKRNVRNTKRVEMERIQSMGVGDTEEPRSTTSASLRSELKAGKGMEIHHRISLIQNTPFFDGLSEVEQREFVTWANKQGWKLGNQPGNPEIVIPKREHTTNHGWLRENGIEGTKHQKSLIQKIQGMNMDDRKFAFRNYMEYVQGGADEFMLDYLGPKSVSSSHTDAQRRNQDFLTRDTQAENLRNSVGNIESGPRAGQRLPVNRRTLGDAIIKDLQIPKLPKGGLKIPKGAALLPAAGLLMGFGQAGHAASQGDYAGAAAHGVGALVGEVPIVGDVAVESVSGTPVADGTLEGHRRIQQQIKQKEQEKKNRQELLAKDPTQERGYESIGRGLSYLNDKLKDFFK
jgi:hypothetical protein